MEGGDAVVVVESNSIVMTNYEHPNYERHICKILRGAILPRREVEDFEIYHIERRFFNGENAIRMVERLLGLDAGMNTVYNYGYKNNHATYDRPELGKRPREQRDESTYD